MVRQYRLVTNGGYDFAKEGQIADLVEVDAGCVILRHDSWQMHPRGDRAWRFWPSEVEEVAAPKFKVGDKVRIVGPSQTGGDVRRGEVVTVSSIQTDHRGNTWYNVTVKPRCPLSTYAATSLEAAVEPPAVKAPYIVMLRGKDGRLAPSSHPAEHTDQQEARDEAARLAKKHGQTFEVWQQVAVVEPPAKLQSPIIAAMHARETAVLTHNGVSQSVVVNSYDFNTSEYLLDMTAKIRVVGEPRIGGTN